MVGQFTKTVANKKNQASVTRRKGNKCWKVKKEYIHGQRLVYKILWKTT